jgi:transcriptional regulator with PAS, ATPase and Fis domain
VIPEAVEGAGAFWLAVAHVAPMAAMSLCSAMVHRAHSLERQADARRAAEAERDRQLHLTAERDAIALEQERRRAELAVWEEGQRIKARVRAEQSDSVRQSVQPSVQSASGRQANTTREQQRQHILRVFAEQSKPNKSELAKQLGIGRTTLYALIDELKAEGKL